MSSYQPGSFFVPQTPTPTKTDKATWEVNDDVKATAFYKALMADSSDGDSDVVVLTEAEKQMFLRDEAVLPKPGNNDRLLAMKLDQDHKAETKFRYSKENCKKNMRTLQTDSESSDTDQMLKRLKAENYAKRVEKRLLQSAHPKLKFVQEKFAGVDNYDTMTATNGEGVQFKRIELADKSIAHDWVIDSERKLFKIDDDKVVVKKPMSRGLVNITRTVRPSFSSLWNMNFADK